MASHSHHDINELWRCPSFGLGLPLSCFHTHGPAPLLSDEDGCRDRTELLFICQWCLLWIWHDPLLWYDLTGLSSNSAGCRLCPLYDSKNIDSENIHKSVSQNSIEHLLFREKLIIITKVVLTSYNRLLEEESQRSVPYLPGNAEFL